MMSVFIQHTIWTHQLKIDFTPSFKAILNHRLVAKRFLASKKKLEFTLKMAS